MEKHYNSFFDETYYTETLDNGLRIVDFYKPEFLTSVCAFGTPYGALDIFQKYGNKHYSFDPGIAHFLEHKLFESKGDDIMNAFSAMGANVNAFTSYRETVYYFSKNGEDIKDSLELLLDFVQSLNISEESVEKEKGIIDQEISMYAQMPDTKLLNEAYKALYHHFPIRYDIGGDRKSIYAISKDELEKCYMINYHPSNMAIVISSPIKPAKIFSIIRNNQKKKSFTKKATPKPDNKIESIETVRKRHIFKADVSTAKHLLAYKFKPDFKDAKEAFRKEWALRFLMEAHFSYLNPEYQKWLDEKIINDYFGYEIEFDMDCAYLMFYIENDDSRILKKLIKESLRKKLLDEDMLEQIKRRYIGSMFDVFNDIESFNNGYIRDYLGGLDYFEAFDELKSITLKDVEKVYESLDFSHYSYVSMIKK